MRQDDRLKNLERDVDKWREHIVYLESEQESLEKQLLTIRFDGWEHFRDQVLRPELDRIAHKSFGEDVDPEDSRANLLLRGQYNQVKRMMQSPEVIEAQLAVIRKELKDSKEKLDRTSKSLERLTKNARRNSR